MNSLQAAESIISLYSPTESRLQYSEPRLFTGHFVPLLLAVTQLLVVATLVLFSWAGALPARNWAVPQRFPATLGTAVWTTNAFVIGNLTDFLTRGRA